ncbi:hypothetical protein [Flagellimonas marina]|uniref:Uncharacterized protein n=1 Tax=Flagellimonas marina TaxID=1775168 RepID=A0ABV8PKH2_9FLAO
MRGFHVILLLLSTSLFSCMDNIGMKPNAKIVAKGGNDFVYWVCIAVDSEKETDAYIEEFKRYRSNGLNIILVNNNEDSVFLNHLIARAETEDLEVHTAHNVSEMTSDKLSEAVEQAKKNGTKKAFFFDYSVLQDR